jgi:hypothetical protein
MYGLFEGFAHAETALGSCAGSITSFAHHIIANEEWVPRICAGGEASARADSRI